MRKLVAYITMLLMLAGIIGIFWYYDWQYSLPTPVPKNYMQVQQGKRIKFSSVYFEENKPVFLHFFNPRCPCSKFNLPHFRSLVNEYDEQVNFAVVVMSKNSYSQEEIKEIIDLDIPVLPDTTLAKECGVYSTPQAVILDNQMNLYYRGNYNKTRYCTEKKTNYAQQALVSLLERKPKAFDQFALKAYGCELPTCEK